MRRDRRGRSKTAQARLDRRSKSQSYILVPAIRTLAKIGATGSAVNLMATNTAERGFSARVFEKLIVAAIVEEPETQKQRGHQKAKGGGCGDEVHEKNVRSGMKSANQEMGTD